LYASRHASFPFSSITSCGLKAAIEVIKTIPACVFCMRTPWHGIMRVKSHPATVLASRFMALDISAREVLSAKRYVCMRHTYAVSTPSRQRIRFCVVVQGLMRWPIIGSRPDDLDLEYCSDRLESDSPTKRKMDGTIATYLLLRREIH